MSETVRKIDADIYVEELVASYPKSVKILMDEGIVCIMCGEPVWGTLRELVEKKGGGVDRIVDLLNRSLD
ncbi:DUF1858 domain-containing protein [candidate division KSB1 bacterium]